MRVRLTILMTAGLAFGSGCATYEVRDVYRSEGALPEYTSDGVTVRAWVAPMRRFYSVGPIGLPIIPTDFGPSERDRLSVVLVLRLRKDAAFSFDPAPCLRVGPRQSICAEEAEISAVAMRQDDGSKHTDSQPRYHWLPEYSGKPHLFVAAASRARQDRITKQDIYRHYGYAGAPWNYLNVTVTYHYRCVEACPPHLELDAAGLMTLDGMHPLPSTVSFVWSRERDFTPWEGNPG